MASPFQFQSGGGSSSSQATGGTGKNYLGTVNNVNGNGNFELGNTNKWSLGVTGSLTNGLPTTTPTFGSGASGNLSISASNSSPLAGSYSLSYASSAATTAGNCLASDAFTIDREDQAKVLTVKFYFEATSNPSNGNWSGTSSNSFAFAIYDVTNSAWIIPAGGFGMTQSSGVGLCTGTFQTSSNGTQYRLVVYNANATSGAITVKFDDFFVGPQTAPIGPVVTDWQSYTPTGTWVTNATYTGKWRRVGDSMEVSANIAVSGAVTGNFSLNLPSGYSIDTAKLTSTASSFITEPIGTIEVNQSGQYHGIIRYNSATSVTAVNLTVSGSLGTSLSEPSLINATTPVTFASGAVVTLRFKVPISGWSSNVQMSSDTDTRVVSTLVSLNAVQAVGTNGVIKYDTVDKDPTASYSTSTGLFTAPVTGFYTVATTNQTNTATALMLYKNGSSYTRLGDLGTNAYASSTYEIYLNAGETVSLVAATAGTFTGSGACKASFSRRSGPAVVAATESVNARYYGVTATITGTASTATFSTKDFDSHNAYSSGTYTIPVSGKYQINASIRVSATFAADQAAVISLYKNGSIVSEMTMQASGTSSNQQPVISDVLSFVAGDALTIRIRSNGTTPTITASNNSNYFSITRVGN